MFTIHPSVSPASGKMEKKEISTLLKATQVVERQSQDLNLSLLTTAPVPLHRGCLFQDPSSLEMGNTKSLVHSRSALISEGWDVKKYL